MDVAKQMEDIFKRALEKVQPKIKDVCYEQCKALYNAAYSELEPYGVTGNLHNSLVVACYWEGKLIAQYDAISKGLKDPTRPTLRRGERYDMKYYWSGGLAEGRAFKATTGKGGADGKLEATRLALQAKTNKAVKCRFVIGVAVEYAKYIETKREKNVLTRLRDELKASGAKVSRMYNK